MYFDMNLVFIRNKMKYDEVISKFIISKFWIDFSIRYSNSWFIIIPNNSKTVFKYYISYDYFKKNISSEYSYINTYNVELNCYSFFSNNWLLIPLIYSTWIERIGDFNFSYIEIENIRLLNNKFNSFFDLDILSIVNFIKKVHFLKTWYILWNIDISNFYTDNLWHIWFFDFSAYWKWNIEKDLAKLIFWYHFKYDFTINIISIYWKNIINFNILLLELNNVYVENNYFYKDNFYLTFKLLKLLIK